MVMCCRAFHKPILQHLEQPIKLRGFNDRPRDYIYLPPVQLGNEVLTALLLNNACKLLREPFKGSDTFLIVELPSYSFLISRASEEITSYIHIEQAIRFMGSTNLDDNNKLRLKQLGIRSWVQNSCTRLETLRVRNDSDVVF
jgi:hypothetical protein